MLVSFAADYQGRQDEIECAAERLRIDRDEAIRTAYNEGMPMSDIASVLDLSHQRVSQIVRS